MNIRSSRSIGKRLLCLILPSLVLLLSACASGPKYKEVADRIPPVPADQGRLFFYRPGSMAGGLKPNIMVNNVSVGRAESKGFRFVDRPPGDYTVATSTLMEHTLSFSLEAGEVKYVRMFSSVGLFAGHIIPNLTDAERALREMNSLAYIGSSNELLD